MKPLFPHLATRHRLLLAYLLLTAVAAAAASAVWPGQRGGIVGATVMGMVAAWAVSLIGERALRRRVHQLREAAQAMTQGDLEQAVAALADTGFIKLSDTMAQLAGQLKARMEEQLLMQRRLSHSDRLALIGELAATVAHEVNNPLDGIQNGVRILRRHLDNTEQTRELLDMMDTGLYRIEMIVRRLLSTSREEPPQLAATRLEDIVEDAVMFARPRLDRAGIELVRDFSAGPLFVMADRSQLVQALINLMLNAADAMPGGGTLTFRGHADAPHVVLEIQDTGPGVAPEHQGRIFEPFYTTKAKGAGTGLGLAVVARVIEAHEGAIECLNSPGTGACFRLTLRQPQRQEVFPHAQHATPAASV